MVTLSELVQARKAWNEAAKAEDGTLCDLWSFIDRSRRDAFLRQFGEVTPETDDILRCWVTIAAEVGLDQPSLQWTPIGKTLTIVTIEGGTPCWYTMSRSPIQQTMKWTPATGWVSIS